MLTRNIIVLYTVATMYVEKTKSTQNGKTYYCYLLRHNYREGGKIKHKTIANISQCSQEEIQAIKLALKYKHDMSALISVSQDLSLKQGLSVGAVWLLYKMAKSLGIEKALGNQREGKLALWQVIARVIDQGSCLSAVRLTGTHAACDILNIKDPFNEDDLYDNLDWLDENQREIEKKLFHHRHPKQIPNLFLYDVTSSYLEGMENAFANYGHNRDKKKGKKQIVLGLLCDDKGAPVSVEVFPGNTNDFETFASQVKKLAGCFGCRRVTLVGDRGMIKSAQIENLHEQEFRYITAITKPQIESLLKKGVFQMDLFDKEIAEVMQEENGRSIRYILRRNPFRARETAEVRRSKTEAVQCLMDKKNEYLSKHTRAHVEAQLRAVRKKIEKLKVSDWLNVTAEGRTLALLKDDMILRKKSKLDGCYVLKSDVPSNVSDARTIHDRYKDLSYVEQAFRTMKTDFLEIRPLNVRTKEHTRGRALVVMLSYAIVHELKKLWKDPDVTVQEGVKSLDTLCSTHILKDRKEICQKIPEPNELNRRLLEASDIIMPDVLPSMGVKVATRKRLADRRMKV